MTDQEELAAEKLVVEQGMDALRAVYGNDTTNAEFARAVVIFSSRLFRIGAIADGIELLALIQPQYFRSAMITQMETDTLFAKTVSVVANTIVQAGKADVAHNDIAINMAGKGEA